MSDTLSCGCPTSGPPCEHASVKGKKRGGAGKLKAERDEAVQLLRELVTALDGWNVERATAAHAAAYTFLAKR